MIQMSSTKSSSLNWSGIQLPPTWQLIPNRALFSERDIRGVENEELLSVTIRYGVVRQFDFLESSTKKDSSNQDKSKYKLVKHGDIAYNKMRMWQGAAGYSSFQGIVSPAYVVLKPARELNSRYYHYLFRTPTYNTLSYRYSYGICDDQLSLRYEDFKRINTPYPPADEQNKIVVFLDNRIEKIDRYISNKKREIELLNEHKVRIIEEGVTTGFQSHPKLIETGIVWVPSIPEGFEVKKFKYCAKIRGGQVDPKLQIYRELPLIAPNHIESKTGRLINLETADHQGADSGKYKIEKGDVIYSKIRPNLQKATITPVDGLCSADMYAIIPNKNLLPEYLLYWLLSRPFTQYAIEESMRVAMPKINRDSLGRAPVIYPKDMSHQKAIVDEINTRLKNMDKGIQKIEKEIDLINEFRSSLIINAVTGKIDISSAV